VTIDERLRAASRALRDSSVAQVDAASRLREIARHGDRLVAHGRATSLPDEPGEPPAPMVLSLPPTTRPSRRTQQLAIVVNLLLAVLVLAVGIVLGRATTSEREAASTTPTVAQAVVPPAPAETVIRTKTSVPESCLDTAELGDEVIARLNRNQRDNRLFLALRDYTIASQACRKEASP
jgi:hypothetical protein